MNDLEQLEIFLREFIEKAQTAGESVALNEAQNYIAGEREIILQRVWSAIDKFQGDPNKTRLYIEHLQIEITRLSDLYHQYLQSQNKQSALCDLTRMLLSELNSLYVYLRENFKLFFNPRLLIPQALKDSYIPSIGKMSKKILGTMTAGGQDKELILLIQDYLFTLSRPGHHRIKTFADLDYLINFTWSVHQLFAEHTETALSLRIFRRLIYLNFNCLPVIWFYINRIKRDYNQVDFYEEELVSAIIELRNLQQMPTKSDFGYQQEAKSLKETLCKVYEEEISCLKRLQRLQSKITYKKWSSMIFTPFYFHVTFTLEQLVLFFRLLIESGVVNAEKKVALFDFISKHIGTARKEQLSFGSIKNKYNNPQYSAAKKIKTALLEMIRLINEKYLA
ncbi:MAG: hypothetical protein JWP78_2693 [Mucilaginibacter sp.]|nr:hypothetical protein [Mucilaginibacter sp.]